MTRYAIICSKSWNVLEYIQAPNPKVAEEIAKALYQDGEIKICYADDYGCAG